MESEAQLDTLITQPLVQAPIPVMPTSNKSNRLKVLFIIALGMLFLTGAVYAGMQIVNNQTLYQQPIVTQPTISPTESVVIPTNTPISTVAPTADQITNWKTYSSTTLGFSFEYPSEYSSPEERENYLSLISPLNSNRGRGYELQNGELKIEIVTEAAKENDSPVKCSNDHGVTNEMIINQSEILVSGISTTIFNWKGIGTGQFICIEHNGKRYMINKYPYETTRQAEFNQILSTFKLKN